ncbi:MAG: 50S ribosomal protein L22 [Candidatus Woykebacteria bacterium RIFCSPHIGHO2_12_FULL_43_10]|uniref:Large ribosomal subunit protein uL22 n=2 Tax=Candidatus Woykeibacteriota TaxID=1817899 RepID=A0A1G1WYP2_9BACT|nr:MAG: 50S ribosomal protein L22 [Candidatus Woykebacteria bacterium RIFCSPHIGHO2_01_FULL_43_29]OGY28701.1 MAG: 50S ribosomal protein L22 [Candidatus Woykebacteria bacterium RIFCSPHIGHO2_02_FULL_43_16b]OGY29776.1 MAG: 50S ribosomal protein L22 [Candidatus Woykebacteria bacterium RIFCSPHIGHO2_12_FULL_43_10]OGY32450.1 MAG: 50S ribosomal protein L22 [Candidatus Woykebacteria bacterium RIFCSPLOWO2_01_FULL_43_14]
MEIVSSNKYIRISPRKVRLLSKKLENLPVGVAVTTLRFMPQKAAIPLIKVIKAATSDAEHNFKRDSQKLVIKKIEVNEGPTLKRSIPRSRGMSHPILKRTTHIKVTLTD